MAARHRPPTDCSTLVQAILCALLAAGIWLSMTTADTQVADCYTNPDVRGTYC